MDRYAGYEVVGRLEEVGRRARGRGCMVGFGFARIGRRVSG